MSECARERRKEREGGRGRTSIAESLQSATNDEDTAARRNGGDEAAEVEDGEAAEEHPLLREVGEPSTGERLKGDAGQEVGAAICGYMSSRQVSSVFSCESCEQERGSREEEQDAHQPTSVKR